MSLKKHLDKVRTDKEKPEKKVPKKDEKLESVRRSLESYIRIGTSYFKKAIRTDKHGSKYEVLERWKIETLHDDFKQVLHEINVYLPKTQAKYSVADFVEKYDSFCNVPDNLNYIRVVDDCYNLYSPIMHNIETWEKYEDTQNINDFLIHLFGDQIEIAQDYLSILLRHPKQILPILCLVSRENNTGKTTFLNLLKAIYQSNAVVLTSDDFQDSFNSHYANKLLIMIDENFVEVEKKKEKERIKQLGTASKIMMQMKGVDKKEIDYYGKLIMTSNFEDNFIRIEEEDMRFWVVKVNEMESRDPDLLDKMILEIPKFLDFLLRREIKHPKTERHWFDNKLLETQARKNVIETTKPMWEEILDAYFREYFEQSEGVIEINMSVTDILNENLKYNKYLNHKNVKEYLRKKNFEYSNKVVRYGYYSFLNGNCTRIEKTGRVYTYKSEEYFGNNIL